MSGVWVAWLRDSLFWRLSWCGQNTHGLRSACAKELSAELDSKIGATILNGDSTPMNRRVFQFFVLILLDFS
jgi:hypothetical protein